MDQWNLQVMISLARSTTLDDSWVVRNLNQSDHMIFSNDPIVYQSRSTRQPANSSPAGYTYQGETGQDQAMSRFQHQLLGNIYIQIQDTDSFSI